MALPPKWNYVKTGLAINLERVLTYNRLYPFALPGQHFLVKLLAAIAGSLATPLERYYDRVDSLALGLSMTLGMTSSYNRGRVHDGVFYGEGCTEVLLLDDDYFDYFKAHERWQEAQPIKVLEHPKSDLRFLPPLGRTTSPEQGLVVISINIAMLAVMYRAFELQKQRVGGTKSMYHFLGGWVIPNMLRSHVDIAVFNRYKRGALGISDHQNEPTLGHPFRLAEYGYIVDECVQWSLEHVKRQHRNFHTTLSNLPAVRAPNMLHALLMPDMPPTLQVDWALHAARLQAIVFLLQVCRPTAAATDRDTLSRIVRAQARNNVMGMIQEMLPPHLSETMVYQMRFIEEEMRK